MSQRRKQQLKPLVRENAGSILNQSSQDNEHSYAQDWIQKMKHEFEESASSVHDSASSCSRSGTCSMAVIKTELNTGSFDSNNEYSDHDNAETEVQPQKTHRKRRVTKITAANVDNSDNYDGNNTKPRPPKKPAVFQFQGDNGPYVGSRLKRYLKVHESPSNPIKTLSCPENGCEFQHDELNEIDRHLETVHGREFIVETLFMKDQAELRRWIHTLKDDEGIRYIRNGVSGTRSVHGGTKKTQSRSWYCNQSHFCKYKRKGTGQRNRTSTKSDFVCTSRLVVFRQEGQDGLRVEYHKTHTGHTIRPKDGLTAAQKRDAAKLILQGVTRYEVLDKLKAKYFFTGKTANKLRDIYNISSSISRKQEAQKKFQECHVQDNTSIIYPEYGEPMNEDLDIEFNLKLADDYYKTAREFVNDPKSAEEFACKMKAFLESLQNPIEPEPELGPPADYDYDDAELPISQAEAYPVITNMVSMQDSSDQPKQPQNKKKPPQPRKPRRSRRKSPIRTRTMAQTKVQVEVPIISSSIATINFDSNLFGVGDLQYYCSLPIA